MAKELFDYQKKIVDEIWKDIPNYKGLYQVSNLGRVKSLGKFKGWYNSKEKYYNHELKMAIAQSYYIKIILVSSIEYIDL